VVDNTEGRKNNVFWRGKRARVLRRKLQGEEVGPTNLGPPRLPRKKGNAPFGGVRRTMAPTGSVVAPKNKKTKDKDGIIQFIWGKPFAEKGCYSDVK